MFKTSLAKIKYYAVCECCNYKALDKSKWEKHLNCQKHKRNGKYKFEDYVCEICGYCAVHTYNFKIHKIVCHGTIEEKKSALFYCKCCNMAFFCDLFYNKHMKSKKHFVKLQRHKIINDHIFKDIDLLLSDQNYMEYVETLEKTICAINKNLI
jgi:hypothetical protein